MKLIHPNSLAATLDVLNEVFFMGHSLSRGEKTTAIRWLASRQGVRGAYRGMIAPTPLDFERGAKLFTGEKVISGAAIGHVLGEESSRALILLDADSPIAHEALKRSNKGMMRALMSCETPARVRGFYCCGTCTAAMWRHLAVGGFRQPKKRLVAGMKALKHYRDGTGKWHRFPFYYTLLAMTDIDLRSAVDEMRYAAPVCEQYLRRYKAKNKLAKRRRLVMEKVLAKC